MVTSIHTLATLIFLSLLIIHSCSVNYVEEACNVTRYRDLCIHSLSPFSNTAKQDPSKWARAGISVNIGEAKSVSRFLIKLKNQKAVIRGGRNLVALFDCIECIEDSLDNLHKSLYVLRKLSAETFVSQMGDVTTWVSAALTDEDTCLDGFDGPKGRQVKLVQNRVKNMSYFTSNALALVAKLATAGLENP